MSAMNKANELASAILQSNECRQLMQAKQVIDRNSSFQNKIKEFKKRQYDFQVSLSPNRQPDKSKMESIKRFYDDIIKTQEIKTYLDAEMRFNEFVATVIKTVSDKIEKGLSR